MNKTNDYYQTYGHICQELKTSAQVKWYKVPLSGYHKGNIHGPRDM